MLVPILAFAATVALVLALAALLRPRTTEQRLARLGAAGGRSAPGEASLVMGGGSSALLRVLGRLGERSAQRGDAGPMRSRLVHAGYRQPAAPAVYYGLRLALALGLPATALTVPHLWALHELQLVVALCALSAAGFLGPSLWLDTRRSRRQGGIRRVLPDALDLMVVCVEAGYGIQQSLARVADEFASRSAALSEEFALVTAETRAGKSLTDALRGLSERTGVEDVSSLVALLVQTERFGTSVANALRVHADAMRVRRMQRAEERAQKAPLKLIFPSTLIFAALMLIFLAPSLYRFMQAFPD